MGIFHPYKWSYGSLITTVFLAQLVVDKESKTDVVFDLAAWFPLMEWNTLGKFWHFGGTCGGYV